MGGEGVITRKSLGRKKRARSVFFFLFLLFFPFLSRLELLIRREVSWIRNGGFYFLFPFSSSFSFFLLSSLTSSSYVCISICMYILQYISIPYIYHIISLYTYIHT